jgi:hypothetical protein
MRWYFYHRQEIGYVYGSTKSYKVFLLGAMFSQKFHDFVLSMLSRNLQCGPAVNFLRLYISTEFEHCSNNRFAGQALSVTCNVKMQTYDVQDEEGCIEGRRHADQEMNRKAASEGSRTAHLTIATHGGVTMSEREEEMTRCDGISIVDKKSDT